MSFDNRKCPYCNKVLNRPYWRHIQLEHPDEFEKDTGTWVQLYKDYRAMGMSEEIAIIAICELFNRTEEQMREFLSEQNAL